VVTFGINGFRRRVDPMGRIIGDDCFETSRSRSGSTLINWRESQEFRAAPKKSGAASNEAISRPPFGSVG